MTHLCGAPVITPTAVERHRANCLTCQRIAHAENSWVPEWEAKVEELKTPIITTRKEAS